MKNLVLIILIFSMFVGNIYTQDVPRVISYQGVLVGADGKPVNAEKLIIKFTFYDTEQNGNPIGTLKDRELKVQGGLFFTLLGNEPEDDLPSFDRPTWLEVETQGNRFRVQMTAAVYALNIPDNLVTSLKIKDGEVDLQDLAPGKVNGEILKWDGAKWTRSQDEGLRTVSVTSPLRGDGTPTNPIKADIPSGVPVGTIVAFYGLSSQLHPDWLLCNGDNVSQSTYPALFNHLNTLYGSSKLPDLRGMFLRGADLGIGNDPDPNKRIYPTGIGENSQGIGSRQDDEFKSHRHYVSETAMSDWGYGGSTGGQPDREPAGYNTDFTGGSETRPKNIYVNYIIKAR
jgi:hypothetical protein